MTADSANDFDRDLLERFCPELHYDPQYDYRVLAAESAVENPGNVLRRRDGEVIGRAGHDLTLDLLSAYPKPFEARGTDTLSFAPDRQGDAERMFDEPRYGPRVYGHSVEREGRIWLQYWLWYYDNPKHLLGFGKHEGD